MAPVPTAGPAIYVYKASPVIANSTFTHNSGSKGSAIACVYSPKAVISNNVLSGNTGGWVGSIVTYGSGSPTISGNVVHDNSAGEAGAGISVEVGASPRIENNIVFRNRAPWAGGIFCWTNANPILLNNTIAYNIASGGGGGISCDVNSDPILINNIICGNTGAQQVSLFDSYSDPHFLYCDIQGGKEGFGGAGAGANYTGLYEDNIDRDPSFVDVIGNNYSLSTVSPCIGAGIDSVEVSGVWYRAPRTCFAGRERPSPTGSNPDLGACESILAAPLAGIVDGDRPIPAEHALYQNYPNPFNPTTVIRYQLPVAGDVKLTVYDVLGRELRVLVDKRRDAGVHEVAFDAVGLAGGAYFYRMQVRPVDFPRLESASGRDSRSGAGTFIQTRTFLLLR